MRLNTKQICEYSGGTLLVEPIDASKLACGISWDSRNISPDDLFVALPGERSNGHRYVADVLRKGALVVLVTDKPNDETCLLAKEMGAAIIEVSDTAHAISDLARAWRSKLKGHIIGVTGSTGKTTTKNLVRDVLKASFSVVATKGNQNNELGVPATLLEADPETEVVVVEMGMRGQGQIAELCAIAAPDMGLITNISEAHLELLKTTENIARAKAELFAALPNGTGIAFMNQSDDFADFVLDEASLEQRQVKTIFFNGSGNPAPHNSSENPTPHNSSENPFVSQGAWAEDITLNAQGQPCFLLHLGSEAQACTLPLRGIHQVANATAAASVAGVLGMKLAPIVQALETSLPEVGRQEIHKTRDGAMIIDDSYNANPDSMRAALLMFEAMEVSGRRIAVLGDMGELGEAARACHEGIGRLAATLTLDRVICVGELSEFVVSAALDEGMSEARIVHLDSIADILGELDITLASEDVVLVKASRFMGLERVVEGLKN
ncbi:MAG: UDP-N-acetylmuramoyl-tripeptide--D-alanyl-D-alanine ligase [Eggerthellaceae bacterium]|nr:UDP-N-acetylmuramoyl-tripeptide--D-alanyl-D-alanine ligase [Eggerthellaceae bacterium]